MKTSKPSNANGAQKEDMGNRDLPPKDPPKVSNDDKDLPIKREASVEPLPFSTDAVLQDEDVSLLTMSSKLAK